MMVQTADLFVSRLLIDCTARTSSVFPEDVALSSVFFTKSKLALAVMYGCSEGQKREMIRRLGTVDPAHYHPMLLPGLIVELERIRLVGRVDDLLDGFALKASSNQELDLGMDKSEMATFLKMCFESRDLMNQIKAEKRQVNKMATRTCKFEHPRASASKDDRFISHSETSQAFETGGKLH